MVATVRISLSPWALLRCRPHTFSLLVAGWLPAAWLASDLSRACSDGSSEETCQADVAASLKPLRWRGASYKSGRDIYGGQHVVDLFSQRFDGPVVNDDWDMLWTHEAEVGELKKRKLTQRPGRLVNHCRYFRAAGQKCYFAGHVRRVHKALESRGAAAELTYLRNYVLNHEEQLAQWRKDAMANPDKPWVVKKCAAGMSTSIHLLRGEELVSFALGPGPSEWTVAQEYLTNPYMGFGQSKFHLRVYVLVTRWGPPPSVFVFNEGVVFRSKSKYEADRLSPSRDIFSSISAEVEALPHATLWNALDADAAAGGSLPGSAVVHARMVASIRAIFGEALEESFGKAIKETRPAEVGFQCFDLFGLDVMLDENLTPLVLEVNTGPNLNIDDRGEEATGLLHGVKAPLLGQVSHWMELYIRRAATAGFNPVSVEREALLNFTRVI